MRIVMKYHTYFFRKLGKIWHNLSSAAVVIGAFRVKLWSCICMQRSEDKILFWLFILQNGSSWNEPWHKKTLASLTLTSFKTRYVTLNMHCSWKSAFLSLDQERRIYIVSKLEYAQCIGGRPIKLIPISRGISSEWYASFVSNYLKNSTWVWLGNTTITNRRQPHGTARKSHPTITRHQEDKINKQSNQLSLPHQDDCNTRMDIK